MEKVNELALEEPQERDQEDGDDNPQDEDYSLNIGG